MPTKTSELLAAAAPGTVELVRAIGDDQLDLPTPCAEYDVRGLINHVYDVAVNFQRLAAGQETDWSVKTDHVAEPGWRDRFATEVKQLVVAWDDPASEEGVAPAMGLPRSTIGLMGVVDLVVHGWDLRGPPASRTSRRGRASRRCTASWTRWARWAGRWAPSARRCRSGRTGPNWTGCSAVPVAIRPGRADRSRPPGRRTRWAGPPTEPAGPPRRIDGVA
ncbi:maleylpyruvate isomerase family mycothiol-dependent enzyme [Micromonospora antibiotica]|uniref:maleylpyruvate isomerase family mycothiol-dependent enzyme n=1 Tax=Micromonospora antibiotica TaxID=2807623 RepID=UPI001FC9884F|nr:maleylpyruvate isomerase family mycothiol-dependent enzyme [Micromonospora antibiotica]